MIKQQRRARSHRRLLTVLLLVTTVAAVALLISCCWCRSGKSKLARELATWHSLGYRTDLADLAKDDSNNLSHYNAAVLYEELDNRIQALSVEEGDAIEHAWELDDPEVVLQKHDDLLELLRNATSMPHCHWSTDYDSIAWDEPARPHCSYVVPWLAESLLRARAKEKRWLDAVRCMEMGLVFIRRLSQDPFVTSFMTQCGRDKHLLRAYEESFRDAMFSLAELISVLEKCDYVRVLEEAYEMEGFRVALLASRGIYAYDPRPGKSRLNTFFSRWYRIGRATRYAATYLRTLRQNMPRFYEPYQRAGFDVPSDLPFGRSYFDPQWIRSMRAGHARACSAQALCTLAITATRLRLLKTPEERERFLAENPPEDPFTGDPIKLWHDGNMIVLQSAGQEEPIEWRWKY